MIQLFNIPNYRIDTSDFSNLLHDGVVAQFENEFARYVGAKYAVSFNSATSAIFLVLNNYFTWDQFKIPTLIPPVVPSAIINSGNYVMFTDNTEWIGKSYVLCDMDLMKIVDSAQEVKANQYKTLREESTSEKILCILYSFYPTKPVGSCDGGMIVSDNKEFIDTMRCLSMNGMSGEVNNWERRQTQVGHKMYMNSVQAYVALQNLRRLDQKKALLGKIRSTYNSFLGMDNTSDHLYRIEVSKQAQFIAMAKEQGIICGIHYRPCHLFNNYGYNLYGANNPNGARLVLKQSEQMAQRTVSIPFHEALKIEEIDKIITFILKNR